MEKRFPGMLKPSLALAAAAAASAGTGAPRRVVSAMATAQAAQRCRMHGCPHRHVHGPRDHGHCCNGCRLNRAHTRNCSGFRSATGSDGGAGVTNEVVATAALADESFIKAAPPR